MQVRASAPPGVHEPLRADRANLDPVVQPVADGGLQRQRISAERIEPEPKRSRRAQCQPQVLRVLALEVIEGVDRGCVYLYQAQHELGGEARGTARLLPGRLAAALQELVGPLRRTTGILEQEEFLLEPGPALQHVIFGMAVAPARRRSGTVKPQNERRDLPEQGGTEIREHLANERTLLSWVRTGISLISIGLVVERAGALVDASMRVGSTNASELFGLALALLGALTLIIGTTQFLRNRRRISTGEFVPSAAAYLIIVTGSLALATVFIIYVLLT